VGYSCPYNHMVLRSVLGFSPNTSIPYHCDFKGSTNRIPSQRAEGACPQTRFLSYPRGGVRIFFFGKGQMVGMFRVFPGGGIRLWDRKGRLALWISTTPSGGRFGVLNPQEEVMGVFESEGEKGHGHLVLYDTKGNVLFEVPHH